MAAVANIAVLSVEPSARVSIIIAMNHPPGAKTLWPVHRCRS